MSVCLVLKGTSKLFFRTAVTFYSPTNRVCLIPFSCIQTSIWSYHCVFILVILIDALWYITVVLICISPAANGAEQRNSFLLWMTPSNSPVIYFLIGLFIVMFLKICHVYIWDRLLFIAKRNFSMFFYLNPFSSILNCSYFLNILVCLHNSVYKVMFNGEIWKNKPKEETKE